MKVFDIPVNFVVEGKDEDQVTERLDRMMKLMDLRIRPSWPTHKFIHEHRIGIPQELDEHEARDYRK